MYLQKVKQKQARHNGESWLIDDRVCYQWYNNAGTEILSPVLNTMEEVIEFAIEKGRLNGNKE
jgi:hypothetical protein